MKTYARLEDLRAEVGREIGVSDWVTIDQARIDRFAEATDDRQWIHVDPVRAASGMFGATVAHGFLTLSLLPHFFETGFTVADVRMGLNYGLDKVRFPEPVRVGSRLRGRFVLDRYEPLAGPSPAAQLVVTCTVEIDGRDKPACVAVSVSRRYT